ncbi:hypothetical protein ACH4F6_37715 [Streptomyces sp. NPDC017936]|uniref:hypothetical protein n=1 Tax=Streptomyces sp. NPDC017936 TaxID=3365016 RepID=UPI00379C1CD5
MSNLKMNRTPRVPAADAVEVGSLLRDPAGRRYVVVRKNGRDYWTAELDDVQCYVDGQGMYDEVAAPEGWDEASYPQTVAGTAAPEIVAALRAAVEYEEKLRAIMVHVPPSQHRRLYNASQDVHNCTAYIARNPESAERFRDLRARELRKVVDITGTEANAAIAVGLDGETVARFLAGQD